MGPDPDPPSPWPALIIMAIVVGALAILGAMGIEKMQEEREEMRAVRTGSTQEAK